MWDSLGINTIEPVTWLTIALFVIVGALLVQGATHARRAVRPARAEGQRTTDVRLEVLWSGVAAVLLLGVFLHVR
ncbi:MAG: hypothetical protein ACRDFX_01215 [Chloroflexota bacterium]